MIVNRGVDAISKTLIHQKILPKTSVKRKKKLLQTKKY